MKLRLTDGREFMLNSCNQVCDPETGRNTLICTLPKDYDLDDLVNELRKDEILEIISILGTDGFLFHSKDFKSADSVSRNIETGEITIKLKGNKK